MFWVCFASTTKLPRALPHCGPAVGRGIRGYHRVMGENLEAVGG